MKKQEDHMNVKTKILGLAVALMALSAGMVYADNGGNFAGGGDSFKGGHECHHGKMHHLTAQVLGLTEDQQKQLKSIKQKDMETMKSVFEQIKSNREALNAEIVKAVPDMNKVNDIQTQMKVLQSQMVDNHLNSILEIKKIMTPEQFVGYMALKKERKMMKHMMGHDKFEKR
jgi:Spy/CpxP family protein refolding chaperone